MELELALVCDEVRERPDGRLDILGIIDELAAPGFPALQEQLTVLFVMAWSHGETGAQSFRADLVDDEDRRVLTIEGETQVPADRRSPRTRVMLPLERVVFPHAGRYRFQLVAGGDVHDACSLRVHEVPASHAPA
jgi:hypothetical protein